MCSTSPSHLQSQIFLKDTKERTNAFITGLTPNTWGFISDEKHRIKSKLLIEEDDLQSRLRDHPLFFCVAMDFVGCIMDDLLREQVVDPGLAYEAELGVDLFDKLNLGWCIISITPTPYKVLEAVDACEKVLRELRRQDFSQQYLDQIRGILLIRQKDETSQMPIGSICHVMCILLLFRLRRTYHTSKILHLCIKLSVWRLYTLYMIS